MDRRLLGEARLARWAWIGTVALSLVGGGLVIGQAALLSWIIQRAFLEDATRADLAVLFLILLGVIGLRSLNQAGIRISAAEVAIRVKADLRQRVIAHLLQLGPAYTQGERSGELAHTATSGIEALDSFFREYLPALFTSTLIPLTILIVVLPIDGLTFIVLLVTAPLIPIFMSLIGSAAQSLAKSRYAQLSQMSAHFLDVMQGLQTLKLFNRSAAQIETIRRITDQYRSSTLAVLRVAFLSAFTLELLATLSVAVVAVEIGLRLLEGELVFEQALFLLVIAPEFYLPLRQLGARFHAGRDGAAAAERIYAILNTPLPETTGRAPVPAYDQIRFENVSVSYSEGTRPALDSFSLTVRRGEHIALVGATGSGKSTIASLLLQFIQPDSGRITLISERSSISLSGVDPRQWRPQIAWVPQRSYLFNASVAENLRLGQPGATKPQLVAAARAARADRFIRGLPSGYETLLGENATRLSGGQAQRVALARALLRDAPIYIFDEATANLDPENESAVQRDLEIRRAGRTVFSIAHRLGTILLADRIVVLDGGRIVETGTHTELLRRQGVYFELLQAFGGGFDG